MALWNKGVPLSETTKEKLRKANLGKKLSDEQKKKMSLAHIGKGHPQSEDTRKKIGLASKGIKGWWKGKKLSKDTRQKMSLAKKGKKSHFWKGGKATTDKKRYFDIEYRLWREAVFDRDNYTCQNCGLRGCYVTAHHIKSWKNYPELRYSIENGVTLCEECHSKTDNYKGKIHKIKNYSK